VAAFALIRGVRDFVLAFQVRDIQHGVGAADAAAPRPHFTATA